MTNQSRILEADSYKFSQFNVLPMGTKGVFSYGEARTKGKKIVMLGMSMWMQKFLSSRLTQEEVDEAEAITQAHGEPFNKAGFQRIIDVHGGYWPVIIKAVPEVMVTDSSNPLYTVEAYDEDSWCASFLETSLQRVVDLGYAPESVVMGSGGGLLQKVNRDTFSFAQKTSAILVGGASSSKWIETVKDPITDHGKKSKGGYLYIPGGIMVYNMGKILYRPTFAEIRANARA